MHPLFLFPFPCQLLLFSSPTSGNHPYNFPLLTSELQLKEVNIKPLTSARTVPEKLADLL